MKQNATSKKSKNQSKKSTIAIPETTTIGGHTFHVEMNDATDLFLMSIDADGACDSDNKTIALFTELDKEQLDETYIHELIEAINGLFVLDMPHPTIQTLAIGLHQALTSGKGRLR